MKKAKMILSAIAIVAVVGGIAAVHAQKSSVIFYTSTEKNGCVADLTTTGVTFASGAPTIYATTILADNCPVETKLTAAQ